jgi:glucose/arabinose dehydrogenase
MVLAPDGRIFVCQQGGALRVIKNGVLLSTPFLTVPVDANGERGLLGVALDPNFSSNQLVYIYYTATTPTIHNRISRFVASGDVACGRQRNCAHESSRSWRDKPQRGSDSLWTRQQPVRCYW